MFWRVSSEALAVPAAGVCVDEVKGFLVSSLVLLSVMMKGGGLPESGVGSLDGF